MTPGNPPLTWAIAFVLTEASDNPNVKGSSVSDAARAYYRLIVCAFSSVARWVDGTRMVLVTGSEPPDDVMVELRRLRVEVLYRDFTRRPPAGFSTIFQASIYTLDALEALQVACPEGHIVLADPDCVSVAPPSSMTLPTADEVGAFPTGFPPEFDSNGLSGVEADRLHHLLDPAVPSTHTYYGGELYVVTAAQVPRLLARADRALDQSRQRSSAALTPLMTTEEHLLNFALRYENVLSLAEVVDRIWTAPSFRNVTPRCASLAVWHLPAEKDRGFPRLKHQFDDRRGWAWTAGPDTYRRKLGRLFGIPRRGPFRSSYDVAGRTVRRLQRRVPATPRQIE